jgi:hypothetical protein
VWEVREAELIVAAVARWYPTNRFAVCDNVSHGFNLFYEADAIAISDTGLCDELEAKSTLSDLHADLKKRKWELIEAGMRQHYADRFWYVVPEELREAAVKQAEPRGFGVVVVTKLRGLVGLQPTFRAERVLAAQRLHPESRERREKFLARRAELWRLAAIRYWSRKQDPKWVEVEAVE